MEKRQAQGYIKEVLNQPFDRERFELFIRNLLNDIEPRDNSYSGNLIPEAFRDHIAHYRRIGKYTDPEGEQLDILIVQTRSVKKLERTRTALRNFVVRHLKSFEKQYALAAFYSKEDDGAEWRFSLVKIDYETKKSEKGKIKVEEELVPAKRFSFLVGEYENAHTAQKQLLPLLTNDHSNSLIVKEKDGDGSIEGAFSIQKVTDEFYEQYKELYLKLAENQSLSDALEQEVLDIERFVKKLLGQIVFLYFIQKKGWLGVPKEAKMGEGSKRFLQERFERAEQNGENYYNIFLKYLFYEALALEHNDEEIKYYYKKLDCKIPFLNGGLFEAEFDWKNTKFTIPNDLFRNNEKNKAGDKGTGILDVFDRYNFTIKEDEPLEKEVAVDPEMLGKVFENMLEIKERKSKGAYYTPREIVHYMCQESLIHYLDNTVNDFTESYQPLGSNQPSLVGGSADKKGTLNLELENKGDIRVPKEDIETFIRKGHLVLEHEATVQNKGKETDSYQFKLPEGIRTHAESLDKALADIKICDPAIGSGAFPVGLLHEVVTARMVLNSFLQHEGYTPYHLKRHAIQESIYGVDIDASAIDIARLRLWLSMIVDEEDYDAIEALPNLDYKIVRGNSLIGMPENAMRDLNVEKELETLKEQFFHETDEKKKKELRTNIDAKIRQLLDSAEEFAGYEIAFDFELFFSEVWHKKDGFDVVIGNPPYGVSIKDNYRKTVLKQFEKVPDYEIYYFFIELAKPLLRKKGINTYIIPNTILFNYFAKKYRVSLLKYWRVHEIIDCTDFKLFDNAVVRNMIYVLEKSDPNEYVGYRNTLSVNSFHDLLNKGKKYIKIKELISFNQNWALAFKLNEITIQTIKKIQNERNKLDRYFDVSQGYIPYRRSDLVKKYGKIEGEAIVDNRKWHSNSKKDDNYKQEIQGRNLSKYSYSKAKSFVWYGKHLAGYVDPKYFNQKRLLVREITNPSIIACLVEEELVNDPQIISIIEKESYPHTLEWLWAILNSSLATFYHFNASPKATKGDFPKILVTDIRNFPLPKFDKNIGEIFTILRNYLLNTFEKSHLMERFFYEIINGIVIGIYFKKELKQASKQILPHLGNLKPITDDMNDEEKLAIIQSEFKRLYDPNHPVRNNLETLDSIEEVRVIKEALK